MREKRVGARFIPSVVVGAGDELIYDSVRKYASTMAHKVAAKWTCRPRCRFEETSPFSPFFRPSTQSIHYRLCFGGNGAARAGSTIHEGHVLLCNEPRNRTSDWWQRDAIGGDDTRAVTSVEAARSSSRRNKASIKGAFFCKILWPVRRKTGSFLPPSSRFERSMPGRGCSTNCSVFRQSMDLGLMERLESNVSRKFRFIGIFIYFNFRTYNSVSTNTMKIAYRGNHCCISLPFSLWGKYVSINRQKSDRGIGKRGTYFFISPLIYFRGAISIFLVPPRNNTLPIR